MADEGAKGYLVFMASVVVAVIAGVVSYVAATIQSRGAIEAAIETAAASNLTGYTVEKGIWIVGKGEKAIVYCEIPSSEDGKKIDDRSIRCTNKTYVLTY